MRVRVVRHRSLGTTTDPGDFTGPLVQELTGDLVCLDIGRPLTVAVRGRRRPWQTSSPVRSILRGRRFTEVATEGTVYWVYVVAEG